LAQERLATYADKAAAGSENKNRLAPSSQIELVRVGRAPELPFDTAQFDAVVGQHVLEHIRDLNAALLEWKRVLQANGLLALATPNALYPDPAHFADVDHTHIFAPRELSAAVENAGFEIQACYTIFPYLSRARLARGLSVIGNRLFRAAPYFASRGRTIVLGARRRQ
jgi:ubiquinone/menaquinone biosynthesis C-methylase UbiE